MKSFLFTTMFFAIAAAKGDAATTEFLPTDLFVIELSGPTYDDTSSILFGKRAMKRLTDVFEQHFLGIPFYVEPGEQVYLSETPAVDFANEDTTKKGRRQLAISTCPASCSSNWTKKCEIKCAGSYAEVGNRRRRMLRSKIDGKDYIDDNQRILKQPSAFDLESCLEDMKLAMQPFESKYNVQLDVLLYTV